MNVKEKPVPAIINDLIAKISNPKENIWIRSNACATLENIRDRCDYEIKQFLTEKDKALAGKQVRR